MSRSASSGTVDASRDRLLQEAAQKQSLEYIPLVRRWLYDMIGYDVGDNLFEALSDGVILCSICNTIRPGIVAKINPAPKVAFKKMENINNFLAAAKRLMVPSSCLFDTIDLVQQANTAKVTKCLLALAEVAARSGKGIKRTGERKAADVELDETVTVILAPGATPPPAENVGISITDEDLAEYLARDEDEEAALVEAEKIKKTEEEKGRQRSETLKKEEEEKRKREQEEEEKRRKEKEENERRARAESDAKKAKEEEEKKKKEKEEAERRARAESDAKKAKEEEEERNRKEAARKANEEADKKAKEEADRKAKEASTPPWAASKLKTTGVSVATESSPAKKAAARYGSSYVAAVPAEPSPPVAKPKANRFQSAYTAPVAAKPAAPVPSSPSTPSTSIGKIDTDALLVWCQQGTFAHDIVVKDLHASWRDGLAFCALIATNKPGALDLNKARSLAKAEQRLAMAFEALAGLGVPSLLDPADFPEEESKIVTYLSLIQKAFGASADDLAAENCWPTAVRDFKKRFEDLDARFGKLTDQDIIAGQGVAMNNELNAMFPELKQLKDDYWPEELRHIILRFNELRKLLPQRVNEVYSKSNAQRSAAAKAAASSAPSSDTCAKCSKPLSGETVEAAGCNWHRSCFACNDCGKKLVNTCLNIGNKPYCEQCGKSAFIKAMRKK